MTRIAFVAPASPGLHHVIEEVYEWLRPWRTLVVGGAPSPTKGSEWMAVPDTIQVPDALWLVEAADVVYVLDHSYGPNVFAAARACGIPTAMHALSPEWYQPEWDHATEVWCPSADDAWDVHRENVRVVPCPVTVTNRLPRRVHGGPLRVLHLPGYHPHDKNATDVARAVQRDLDPDIATLTIPDESEWFGDHYAKDEWDLLFLPRRYGTGSLLTDEAAVNGVPSLMLDRHPERTWPSVIHVPVTYTTQHSDGIRTSHTALRCLVNAVHDLANDRTMLARVSNDGLAWTVASRSWFRWGPVIRAYLDGLAEYG